VKTEFLVWGEWTTGVGVRLRKLLMIEELLKSSARSNVWPFTRHG